MGSVRHAALLVVGLKTLSYCNTFNIVLMRRLVKLFTLHFTGDNVGSEGKAESK